MVFPFRSNSSRKTICCSNSDEENDRARPRDDRTLSTSCSSTTTSLTVWRKSLLFSCQGFTVIDSDGNLAFRVDNYAERYRPSRIVLMDGAGVPMLTMFRRKQRLGLVDNWLIFEGEVEECRHETMVTKKPIFSVRKSMNVLQSNMNVLAYVYRGIPHSDQKIRHSLTIEGSYAIRSCKVFDESRRVVAEVKKKEATIGGVSFGIDVFVLVVHPGFDSGIAMALVLLLDQMF